ncbi:MAG: AraC family transcriptional regulator [Clostridia bacterium]|nr:AraC family transcriptional regulator [Clostridia bacterium]
MTQLLKKNVFPHYSFYSRCTVLSDTTTQSAPHTHDFYEVFIVEEGPLYHYINGNCEVLHPDTLVLIRPEDRHSFACKDNKKARFFNLAFDDRLYRKAQKMAIQCAPAVQHHSLSSVVLLPHQLSRLLLRRMKWLQDMSTPVPQEVQQTEGVTLLADIIVLCALGGGNAHAIPYWLRKACWSMYQQENMIVGIPRLVELCGKTQEHITRSMKKYMHTSPSAYINTIRLERVAEALATTERPIFDIMLDAGFQNTSYFNKLFKEKYHMSPRKYRSEAMIILGKAE